MGHPIRFGLLCAAGILLGFLLLPTVPEFGGVVIIATCGVVLISWACRTSR